MNTDLLILFGTVTGNAEDCAKRLSRKMTDLGLPHRLKNMGDYTAEALKDETLVAVVVSTWGDGEPPDDAISFYRGLEKLEQQSLSRLSFAVFGLGDTNYDLFCECGKLTERLFLQYGATPILERVDADVDFESPLGGWLEALLSKVPSQQEQRV